MAEYTIELKDLLSMGYELNLKNYPIFSEDYRSYLNNKIIEHFYFREIGQETPDRFNFFLGRTMNEIMPYYNQLYKSELIKFDPLATNYFEELSKRQREEKTENKIDNTKSNNLTSSDRYSKNTDTTENEVIESDDTEHNENKYAKLGAENSTTDINTITNSTTDKTENELTTNDLIETNEQTENITSTKTNDLTETENETIESTSTVTNDLTNTTTVKNTGTGTSNTSGSKDSIFSDIPQSGVETTKTIAPDGTITIVTNGYATTQTTESTNEKSNTTTSENSDSTSKQTGTVVTDGNSTRNNTKSNTGTVKDEGNNSSNYSKSNTGTVNVDKTGNEKTDTTTTTSESFNKSWSENGNSSGDKDSTFNQNSDRKGNEQESSERNIINAEKEKSKTKSNNISSETDSINKISKGRTDYSPAKLIIEYRASLINIDMQIIGELEKLFMEVY